MLDGLLGRGFAAKCKSLVKLTKSRIDVIRRKRKATMKFLKKDIADLLANGLDINAYGRADGLLVELTVSSCYDYIEETCDFVLKHLPVIQKLRECPEECREAVSSLMFAAARFSDLPELRDLRQMFHERYGNSLEYFANKEFVEKLSSKPAKMESKVQLMQDIALEFSIRWDSMAFQHRMSNPSVPAQGLNKNLGPYHEQADNRRSVHREDCAPKGDRHKFAHKEGRELPPKYDYSPRHSNEGHASKRTEINLHSRREIIDNGYKSMNGTKETIPRDHGFEGGRENIVEKNGPWIQQEGTNTRKDRFGSSSHRNGQENPDERSRLQNSIRIADATRNGQEGKEADKLRPYYNNAIPPPYVKPNSKRKDDKYSANPGSTLDRANIQIGDHSDHERQAGLMTMNGHDHEKDGVTDDPSRKIKPVRRRHSRSRSHHEDVDDSEQTPVPARKPRSKRRDDPRRGLQVLVGDGFDDEKDEEERVIDRLLMHYSKKPTLELEKLRRKPKSRRSHHRDKPHEEAEMAHAPLRSSSLPREQSAPSETTKVFARAASFQPDRSSPARHVHPKLPDYEDLAARFASLKGR